MTKDKILKVVPTPPKKNKPVWKPKEEAPKSTTKNKQDGVEAEERAALRIHFSEIGHFISKQEINGEQSYSLDFKGWALAKGKSVVIPYINNKRY